MTDESVHAFPHVVLDGSSVRLEGGLSKRELFAAMAMQGFIAANLQGIPMSGEELSRRSLACADDLIKGLNKPKGETDENRTSSVGK